MNAIVFGRGGWTHQLHNPAEGAKEPYEMVDIFISYTPTDQDVVQRLAAALEAQGWSVFWDRTIPAGETWRTYIGKALEDARCVIVAWSNDSIESHWVQEEAEDARTRNVLLPVLLAAVNPPIGFRSITAANLVGWDGDAVDDLFVRFRTDVSRRLGDPPALIEEREHQRVEAEREAAAREEKQRAEAERKGREQEARQRREAERVAEQKKRQAALVDANARKREPPTWEPATAGPNLLRKRMAVAVAVVISIIAALAVGEWINKPPATYGFTVASTPPGASIEIENVGQYEPGMRLEAGTYTIHATLAGYLPEEKSVEVDEHGVALEIELQAEVPLPELVRMPAGTFAMGSEDGRLNERPVREVRISEPFYLAATEVTFEQYDAFAEATGRELPDDRDWGRGNRPVINVSWENATTYAQWLSEETGNDCRLPSEAEWEYAAQAGTTTSFALPVPNPGRPDKEGGSDSLTGLANCRDCSSPTALRVGVSTTEIESLIGSQTIPVGSFEPNAWGLHDMHGNVWEWVQDCWHDSYEVAPGDGSSWLEENGGDCGRRVLRGGSWFNPQVSARSAYRFRINPNYRVSFIGFRVLCSSPISNTDH